MSNSAKPWVKSIHHVAIIVSDMEAAKSFYINVLNCRVLAENYREERRSWKVDLALPDGTQIELFTFPDAPERPGWPEARGLRHLALATADLDAALANLRELGVPHEPVRVDPYTQKRFAFFQDPDGLPLEIYEEPPKPV